MTRNNQSIKFEDSALVPRGISRFSRTSKLEDKQSAEDHNPYGSEEVDEQDDNDKRPEPNVREFTAGEGKAKKSKRFNNTKSLFKQTLRSSKVEVSDVESAARIRLVEQFFARQAGPTKTEFSQTLQPKRKHI